MFYTDSFVDVIQKASHNVIKHGIRQVQPIHLLDAALKLELTGAKKLLTLAGVDIEALKEKVDSELGMRTRNTSIQ